jgi:hypothetical protein
MKQETIEEAAEKYAKNWEEIHGLSWDNLNLTPEQVSQLDFKAGAKWKQEQELEKLKEAYSMGRVGKSIKEFNRTFKQQEK